MLVSLLALVMENQPIQFRPRRIGSGGEEIRQTHASAYDTKDLLYRQSTGVLVSWLFRL